MNAAGQREVELQKRSNSNAAHQHEAFSSHRRRLTELLAARAGRVGERESRLCVLGAGNCNDLDLELLASRYRSIHLVDIDADALERARERQTERVRAALVPVAPLDLSGLLEPLERWRSMRIEPEEAIDHPTRTAESIARRLGEPFDVVVSACVLSQMHLAVRNVLSDGHRLFQAASYTLNLTHLRTLARLAQPDRGVALLASDVATEQMAPLEGAEAGDGVALLARQLSTGGVFDAVRPDALAAIARDDPGLRGQLGTARIVDAWVWRNGGRRAFLVYTLELHRAGRGERLE